jgi:hypothetical protein
MIRDGKRLTQLFLSLLLMVLAAGLVSAHGGSLSGGSREPIRIPTWLFLSTGGAAVGASFLLASFVTDRQFIKRLHHWGFPIRTENTRVAVTTGIDAVATALASITLAAAAYTVTYLVLLG